MKKEDKLMFSIVLRYLIILLFGFGNLYLFYLILTPLTNYAVFGVVKLVDVSAYLFEGYIYLTNLSVGIVEACVAGAGFYLLFTLAMSVRNISLKERVALIFFNFCLFYLLNVTRILGLIFIYGNRFFDLIHWILWNVVSIFLLLAVWFLSVYLFRIKSIPIFDDLNLFFKEYQLIKKRNKKKIFKKKH